MISLRKNKILFYNVPPDVDLEELNRYTSDTFEIVSDHACLQCAEVIIFHMPTLSRHESIIQHGKKSDGQIWVFWSTECAARAKWQYEPEIFGLFDVVATYKLDSDVPLPYFYPHYFGLLRREPVKKTGLINAFISGTSDQSNRLGYLKELMSYIDVHSYGKMLNNRTIVHDEGKKTKEKIIAGYKFTIAFENAIAPDYVTEKLFDPLIAGSVPIYLGAPNVETFLPGNHCYINIESFSSFKDLAYYLLELDKDQLSYGEYLNWKTRPFKLDFNLKANLVATHPIYRLCGVINQRMKNTFPVK